MQVGGLIFNQSVGQISSQNNGSGNNENNNFKNLFSTLTSNSVVNQLENQSHSSNEQELQLQSLVQLLNTTDILDLEEGLNLLNQYLANDNSLFSLFNQDGELSNLIESLLAKLADETDKEIFSTNLSDSEGYQAFIALLSQIDQLSMKDLKGMVNEDFSEFVKIAKYAQLLDENEFTATERKQLAELLNSLKEKLQSLLSNENKGDGRSQNNRLEYLNSTFTKVAEELQSRSRAAANNLNQEPKTIKSDAINGQAFMSHLSRPEQLTLTLNMVQREVNTADLIKQFENILARSQFTNANGTQKLFIRLYPEHLGSLRIELTQSETGMVARILTTTLAAKEALETQLQALKQSFQLQNIQVDRIEINQQLSNQDRFIDKEQQNHQGEQQQQRHDQSSDENEEGNNFTSTLEEVLVNTEA